MKLDLSCIKDILVSFESIEANKIFQFNCNEVEDFPLLQKYNDEEINYHVQYCINQGMLKAKPSGYKGYLVFGLDAKGHGFLLKSQNND